MLCQNSTIDGLSPRRQALHPQARRALIVLGTSSLLRRDVIGFCQHVGALVFPEAGSLPLVTLAAARLASLAAQRGFTGKHLQLRTEAVPRWQRRTLHLWQRTVASQAA
jgi:hypothetical protein